MLEEGDPAVWDFLPREPGLSAEYADGLAPRTLADALGLDPDATDPEVVDESAAACENAIQAAFLDACEDVLRAFFCAWPGGVVSSAILALHLNRKGLTMTQDTFTNLADCVAHLTHEHGHYRVPCSRYGSTIADVAVAAARASQLHAHGNDRPWDCGLADEYMDLAVNDHEDVAYVLISYGTPDDRVLAGAERQCGDSPHLRDVKAQAWDRLMAAANASTDVALMEAWHWYQRASERWWGVAEGSEGLFYVERGNDREGPYPCDEAYKVAADLNGA